MRVLLADPPAKGTNIDDSFPTLGLLYLAGSLKAAFDKAELEIAYTGPRHSLKTHVQLVEHFRPDVYAISFATKSAGVAFETIKAVRNACPDTWIVAGGAHSTAMPRQIFQESPVDVVGRGEGEITFTELVKAMAGNEKPDFESVAGILFRRNGEIVETAPRPLVGNLDDIPFPAWEMVDFRDYDGNHLKQQPIDTCMAISRGCPFDCAFCSNPVWKCSKPWLRSRSVENICAEIEVLYDRGVREIYLTSDELNFSEEWAIKLCRGIASLELSDLCVQTNLRADKVSQKLVEAMAEANCWLVHLGIESGNDRVLKGIGKKVTVAQIEDAARLLSRAGLKVFAFMMLYQVWEEDGELCWETSEEVENSLRLMKRLFRAGWIHYMSWQSCIPLPGARAYEIARKRNLYRGNLEKVWETFAEGAPQLKLPDVSRRTMQWQIKKGTVVKDWFMIKSGAINLRHLWRAWDNFKTLVK